MSYDPQELLTIKQVSEITKLSYDVLLSACHNPVSGLEASDLSLISGGRKRQWRISRQSLADWIKSRSNQAGRKRPKTRKRRDDSNVIGFVK